MLFQSMDAVLGRPLLVLQSVDIRTHTVMICGVGIGLIKDVRAQMLLIHLISSTGSLGH